MNPQTYTIRGADGRLYEVTDDSLTATDTPIEQHHTQAYGENERQADAAGGGKSAIAVLVSGSSHRNWRE